MPSKKFLELQEFSDEDLGIELKETETQCKKLKFDHTIKGLDNPLLLKEVKRDIARLKTEIRRRQIAGMDEAALAKRSRIRNRRRKH